MERMNPEQLEKLVHQALRSLPDRRAPASLEARVRAAIERQATIPWWHKSWSYWPQSVRAGFLVLCTGLVGLFVFVGLQIHWQGNVDFSQLQHTLAPVQDLVDRVVGIGRGIRDFGALVMRHIPSWWLYALVAFVAGLYAMLFGLGAAAYRTLWYRR